jgi:hypothetical protein
MQRLKVLKDRYTLPEAIARAVGFRTPLVHSDAQLFTNYAGAANRFASIGNGLEKLCREHLDFELQPPVVEGLGAGTAALPYTESVGQLELRIQIAIDELVRRLDVPQLGRIEWSDPESCRFTFFEVRRDRGILRNTVKRVAHTHELVKARQHRLPAEEIAMPAKAQAIIKAIPEPLLPQVRIITGLEVLKSEHEDSRRQELTRVGRALDSGKRRALDAVDSLAAGGRAAAMKARDTVSSEEFQRGAAKAAAVGLAAVAGGAILGGIYSALTAAASVASVAVPLAIADPAIVLGEFCVFGWEDVS